MKLVLMLRGVVPVLFLVAILASCQGQSMPSAVPLQEAIAAQDKALFDAYNTCDLVKLGTMVTDDLEFYHDKTGLAVGKQVFLDSIKQNICGKVTRELVPGTLEVHELAHYGAVEIGVHRFHHPGQKDHDVLGEGKFVMLWQNKDGMWKLTRVISYDHATLPK
ncbi:nuclear transport factor 2 family protein [Granulicella arctica]|uniref:nuclear transport factor 2 family protein n=1 Tax=Granulicella arctica TaxID=940613 RepID=UPI0021DF452A|nr:nuclear transport factor 2 family protein [Granulicella arctica]